MTRNMEGYVIQILFKNQQRSDMVRVSSISHMKTSNPVVETQRLEQIFEDTE